MANSSHISKILTKRLSKYRLFYVCRDIERAMGASLDLKNYFIITNDTAFSSKIAKKYNTVILIKNTRLLDTAELLQHPKTQQTIKTKDFVMVFKNNTIIEKICRENRWKLLNPLSQLADKVESKISQVQWLGNLATFLPPHRISTCAQTIWESKKFILQFNHSHTGSGTFLIDSAPKLRELQQKFPNRPVRIMDYIDGPVLTNNNIVWNTQILIGNISYQITGLAPFTDSAFTTIGNDWLLPITLLNAAQIKQYKKIVTSVGKKLYKRGWKGLFGIDMIADAKTGKLFLLEINARQPASTTFESQLQKLEPSSTLSFPLQAGIQSIQPDNGFPVKPGMTDNITTFEAHLAALLDIKPQNYQLIKIKNGAQIVQRVTSKIPKINKVKIKNQAILNIIEYNNKSLGSDLLRIQLGQGLMKAHNTFNELGKIIASSLC